MNKKTKTLLLCLFLGWLGIHKFYENKTFTGLLYVAFSWTGVPALLSLIDLVVIILTPAIYFDKEK